MEEITLWWKKFRFLAEPNASLRHDELLKQKRTTSNIKHVSLIIGNETRGISKEMHSCCNEIFSKAKTQKQSVRICLENDVESLNCSIAFAIIGFEIKKLLC